MAIKPRHLLSLLQTGFTTVQVRFEETPANRAVNQPAAKLYTYKIEGPCLPGDYLVVESPSRGLVVVRAVTVDESPRIDLDAEFTYKWVVQRIDTAAYKARMEKEKAFLVQVENVQRVAQREHLLTQYAEAFPVGTPAGDAFAAAVAEFKAPLAVLPAEVPGPSVPVADPADID